MVSEMLLILCPTHPYAATNEARIIDGIITLRNWERNYPTSR